jgi:thiol:disulfide interchange protein
LRDIITGLQVLALVAALVFVASYWIRARWWESPTGRNIMGVSISVAAVLGLIVAQRFSPDYTGRVVLQTIVYTSTATFFIQRTVQMLRAQRDPHYRKETP